MKAEYVDHMGNDLSVVNAARVSFSKTSKEFSQGDERLIDFLAKHDHWTPFAHTAITLRMEAPIPIRTQAFKHKTGLVENEESRRYIKTNPKVFIPEFRYAADDKKQGSGAVITDDMLLNTIDYEYQIATRAAVDAYELLLSHGVCEEQARFLLPQACEVNWIWTGNLVSFANFVKKRTHPTAQKEVSMLADQVNAVITPLFPHSWAALIE